MKSQQLTLPRNDLKKQEILSKIAEKIEENKEYNEEEINVIVKSFNVDDYTLFRRELVNFNYLGKDTEKGIYWLKKAKLSQEDLDKIGKAQEKRVKNEMEEG